MGKNNLEKYAGEYIKDGQIAEIFLTAEEKMFIDNFLRISDSLRKKILRKTGLQELTSKEDDFVKERAIKK
jgi:hypothetical protein